MYAFIYVFDEKAMESLLKRNYRLLRKDEENNIWIFENSAPENYDFELEFPHILSNTMRF